MLLHWNPVLSLIVFGACSRSCSIIETLSYLMCSFSQSLHVPSSWLKFSDYLLVDLVRLAHLLATGCWYLYTCGSTLITYIEDLDAFIHAFLTLTLAGTRAQRVYFWQPQQHSWSLGLCSPFMKNLLFLLPAHKSLNPLWAARCFSRSIVETVNTHWLYSLLESVRAWSLNP
jgi:hypothetical protein